MELQIQQNISTAFHPQTDGLTERTNQWVEQYLRLISSNQEDWSQWLPLATVVHNNALNSSSGFTPNQLLIGINPPLTPDQQVRSNNQTTTDHVQELLQNRSLAEAALNAIQCSIPASQWKIGQKVWLEAKNL